MDIAETLCYHLYMQGLNKTLTVIPTPAPDVDSFLNYIKEVYFDYGKSTFEVRSRYSGELLIKTKESYYGKEYFFRKYSINPNDPLVLVAWEVTSSWHLLYFFDKPKNNSLTNFIANRFK